MGHVSKRLRVPAGKLQWGLAGANFRPLGTPPKRRPQIPAGVYSLGSDMEGWYLHPTDIVTDELIEVPSAPINRVVSRVQRFKAARESYRSFGVLYKTGILMYGPAGCGKTGLIRRLSNQFVADGTIVVQASYNSAFTANVLQVIRQIEPERLIVVEMEDIDAIADHDEEELLALLDGANQVDGVVYLATTNKIAELPDRIKNRPSRIDDRVYVGPPDLACRTAYLLAKWPGVQWDERVENIAKLTDAFSYAHLKEVVVSVGCLGHEPEEAIRRLRLMMEVPSAEDKTAAAADEKFLAGVGVAGTAGAA